jgi:ATP-dependent Clp protease adaptor protein ClpS
MKELGQSHTLQKTIETADFQLVLYNDDHNTFDHVINCLVEYCKHDVYQAEQCAWIVHTKGKCAVKSGEYALLEPLCTALLDKGLSAQIEMA